MIGVTVRVETRKVDANLVVWVHDEIHLWCNQGND
jgi:hypothetical protein